MDMILDINLDIWGIRGLLAITCIWGVREVHTSVPRMDILRNFLMFITSTAIARLHSSP
jgi:hypothetical protein